MTSSDYKKLLKTTYDVMETIMTHLLSEKILIKYDKIVEPSFKLRSDRLELQKESINNKIDILKFNIDDYVKPQKELDGHEKALMFDLICVITQTTLGYFEILKTFLQQCLDLQKLSFNTERPMYGQIIIALQNYKNSDDVKFFENGGLYKLFNVVMRNNLAHDDWWLNDKRHFTVIEDGKEVSLHIGELFGELAGINAIVMAFSEIYLKNLFPDTYVQLKHENPEFFLEK